MVDVLPESIVEELEVNGEAGMYFVQLKDEKETISTVRVIKK